MGFRSISMAALRFVLLFALCVGVLSKIDRLEDDVEDPADMADEFLNQMSYDKLDKDQDEGQMVATELEGLNQAAAQVGNDLPDKLGITDNDVHPDMGESADMEAQAPAPAPADPAPTAADECRDTNAEICNHKSVLCQHKQHGKDILNECPATCGLCDSMQVSTECKDKTGSCTLSDYKSSCSDPTVRSTCPVTCNACP